MRKISLAAKGSVPYLKYHLNRMYGDALLKFDKIRQGGFMNI
jgi:hypothetical protein